MLVLVSEDVSEVHLFWYYLSSISGFLTVIVNTILLIHVIYHYYTHVDSKISESNPTKIRPDKPLHYLTCSYFICGILSATCFGLIRSNLFTSYSYNNSSFSSQSHSMIDSTLGIQCAVGYFGSYLFQIFGKVVLYYLLLRRIQIVFRNSCYDYQPNFYHLLYKLLVPIAPFIIISLIFIGKLIYPQQIQWILHYHKSSGLLYCGASSDFNGWIIAAFVFGLVYDFCLTTTLVVAFLKSLYSLQMDTLEQHLAEVNMVAEIRNENKSDHNYNHKSPHNLPLPVPTANSNSIPSMNTEKESPTNSGESADIEIQCVSTTPEPPMQSPAISPSPRSSSKIWQLGVDIVIQDKPQMMKNSISFQQSIDSVMTVMEEYEQSTRSQKDRIKRLIILLKLSKKQTILACIAILSTLLFVILSLISSKVSLQMCIDILINSICVWLMNGSASKYWNWATKYCCCYICYWKIHTLTQRQKSFWD